MTLKEKIDILPTHYDSTITDEKINELFDSLPSTYSGLLYSFKCYYMVYKDDTNELAIMAIKMQSSFRIIELWKNFNLKRIVDYDKQFNTQRFSEIYENGINKVYSNSNPSFRNNHKTGKWFYYDDKGKIIKKEKYSSKGELVKVKEYKHPRKPFLIWLFPYNHPEGYKYTIY